MAKHDEATKTSEADTGTDPVVAAEPTEPTAPTEPTTPTEPTAADAFGTAWADALDARDVATGDIPTGALDAVKQTYRRVPAASRGALVAKLSADTGTAAMSSGKPDVGALLASAKLSAAVSEAAEQGAVRESVKRDPAVVATEQYALLSVARQAVLDALDTDEQRDAVRGGWEAVATAEPTDNMTAKLARVMRSLGSGTRSTSGTRSALSIGERIVAAFHATDANGNYLLPTGEPVSYGAIARAGDMPSGGAVQNALPGGTSDAHLVGMTTDSRTPTGAPRTVIVADRDALSVPTDSGNSDDSDS